MSSIERINFIANLLQIYIKNSNYTQTREKLTTGSFLHPNKTAISQPVVRLLSHCCPIVFPIKMGQQWDKNWTT
ncbi:MAG: hypothetical protein J6V98_05925, partial [Bacteroidales bacterium]|nr:hypothetical protein [Bacteroidales bacterium]